MTMGMMRRRLMSLPQTLTIRRLSTSSTITETTTTTTTILSTSDTAEESLTAHQRELIDCMLRVDQAGELGADAIYKGQMDVLRKDEDVGPVIQHMWDQEKLHLSVMNKMVSENRIRPSALTPFWSIAGYTLGVASALLGPRAAMACTEAVEEVINEHYNDQIRELMTMKGNAQVSKLQNIIREFRDDELGHMHVAVEHDSKQAPLYDPITAVIRQGCRTAIWIASRV